jgi:hypothetical protein
VKDVFRLVNDGQVPVETGERGAVKLGGKTVSGYRHLLLVDRNDDVLLLEQVNL